MNDLETHGCDIAAAGASPRRDALRQAARLSLATGGVKAIVCHVTITVHGGPDGQRHGAILLMDGRPADAD